MAQFKSILPISCRKIQISPSDSLLAPMKVVFGVTSVLAGIFEYCTTHHNITFCPALIPGNNQIVSCPWHTGALVRCVIAGHPERLRVAEVLCSVTSTDSFECYCILGIRFQLPSVLGCI